MSAFLSGAETGFLLSVLLKPTIITCVVRGMCTPMLLAEFAMLLKSNFCGNPDCRIGTRAFLPFLTLVERLVKFLKSIQFALLVGADAFNCFQQSQKRAHVHRRHALLVHVVLVLPLERTHTQHMSPYLSLHERNILGLGAGICVWAVVEAQHLCNVGVELLYTQYELAYVDALGLPKYILDVVLFLLSHIDGKRSEKVKHHKILKRLARHYPWAFQRVTLIVDEWVTFHLLADDLVS